MNNMPDVAMNTGIKVAVFLINICVFTEKRRWGTASFFTYYICSDRVVFHSKVLFIQGCEDAPKGRGTEIVSHILMVFVLRMGALRGV
jgi:hypothetical protein